MALIPTPPSGVPLFNPVTGTVDVLWQNYFNALATISAGFAPLDARYWVSTPNSDLTNETNLGALSSGYLKLTTAAGVGTPSTVTAIPGSDVTGAAFTKSDDTNVTATLGGSATTALLRAMSLTLGWAGTLAVTRGGWGLATLTAHALYVGNGASAPTALAVGATNTVLHGNTGADPSYSAVSLTADVSGTLPVGNGGTGDTTLAAHGVLLGNGASAVVVTGAGTSGQLLTSNGAAADPSFKTFTPTAYAAATYSTANPTATSSATAVMMGLAASITPAVSGNVSVTISGYGSNNTAGAAGVYQIAYGTGAAPANGAAATGTLAGQAAVFLVSAANQAFPFSRTALITGLSLGTAYWLDLQFRQAIGGTASVNLVDTVAVEV